MSNANRMVPRPEREPTGPKKLEEIRLPTEAEVKKGLLDTKVEPENALSLSEFKVMKFIKEIQTKFSKILETKAGLLAKLEEITDYETLLQRLGSYFTEMTEVINNLVSEIEENEQIPQMLGVEAVKELIEEIQNSLYLDPEKNGDLINKLQSLPETYLEDNIARFQLALILDGGNKLKKFKRHVQAALIHNDDKKLKGLVQEISALEIMQLSPSLSSSLPQEIEACELQVEYQRMIEMIKEAQRRLRKLGPST